MADSKCQENADAKLKRTRGSNFSPTEILTLLEEYKKVRGGIEGTKVSQSSKNELWVGIAYRVSEVGIAQRTVKDVKTKWANLTRKSKSDNLVYKRSLGQTGGGPPVQSPQGIFRDIIELNQDNESFQGIEGGLETELGGDTDRSVCETGINDSKDDDAEEEIAMDVCTQATDTVSECGSGRLTTACGMQVLHPANVNVQITDTVKNNKPDKVKPLQHPIKKKQGITQEMVWEAQMKFFNEQTLTERRIRQLMDVKEEFYKAATSALQNGTVGNVSDTFQCLKETLNGQLVQDISAYVNAPEL